MATETVNQPQHNFVKREIPQLFKFEKPGDMLKGVLVKIERLQGDTKPYMQYTIHDKKHNKLYRFNGGYQLDNMILMTDRGKFIMVTYTGEDNTVSKGGNAMKTFDVQVDEGQAGAGPLQITDEDIPF